MKTLLGSFLSLLLLTAMPVGADDASPPPSDGGLAAKMQPFIDKSVIAGCVALVADKDKVLDLEPVGYSILDSKTPMPPNAMFWIASMTKSFTGVAIAMMVDEGKLDINDPVEKYIPEFKGQMVVDNSDPKNPGTPHPPQHPITIRECMSHTSGLPQEGQKPFVNHYDLEQNVLEIAKMPLLWEPGTKFSYNNTGINVSGYIVQKLSGMPYGDFIQQRILTPLQMTDTTFWPNDEQASRLAHTSVWDTATSTLINVKPDANALAHRGPVPAPLFTQYIADLTPTYEHHYAMPAGGLYSTATDISKFCRMLLNGGTYLGTTYLSPNALKLISTPEVPDSVKTGDETYGQGFFVEKHSLPETPSAGSFGHPGALRTHMWIDPTNQLVLILMIQSTESKPFQANYKALKTAFLQTAIQKYGHPATAAQ